MCNKYFCGRDLTHTNTWNEAEWKKITKETF